MMRADALNSHVYPVGTEMTATKQILILHVCSMEEIKSEEFLVNETLSQVSYTDEEETNIITFGEISTEKSESECVN